jgi:hypothetical protein
MRPISYKFKFKFEIDINNDEVLKTIERKHTEKIKKLLIVTGSAQQCRAQIISVSRICQKRSGFPCYAKI